MFSSNSLFAGNEMRPSFMIIFALLMIWTFIWKGLALWKSAHNESRVWFVILLVINTFGILEIIYYFFLDKGSEEVCVCETKCLCVEEAEEVK